MGQVRSWGSRFLTLTTTLLLLSFTVFVLAQSDTASITGFVRDASGAVVPKRHIVIAMKPPALNARPHPAPLVISLFQSPPALYNNFGGSHRIQEIRIDQNKLDPQHHCHRRRHPANRFGDGYSNRCRRSRRHPV